MQRWEYWRVRVERGKSVHAPLTSTVHSFANNEGQGNYGPTIILQHELQYSFGFLVAFTVKVVRGKHLLGVGLRPVTPPPLPGNQLADQLQSLCGRGG